MIEFYCGSCGAPFGSFVVEHRPAGLLLTDLEGNLAPNETFGSRLKYRFRCTCGVDVVRSAHRWELPEDGRLALT